MKKLTLFMVIAFIVLSFIPAQLTAAKESKVKTDSPTVITATELSITTAQLARLEEIKAMDMSTLSRSEKKVLRTEVKAIKSDQDERRRRYRDRGYRDNYDGRGHGGTVFIYGGGGLLLIILLILLFA